MTPDELDIALARLGMTQKGAARYFGVGPSTIRRYLAGTRPIPTVLPGYRRLI
jgi:hypothetical protein